MYEDDYLSRQLRKAIEALARLAGGQPVQAQDLDEAFRDAVGLDLRTLDKLPADALMALMVEGDDRGAERLRTVAALLEACAPPGRPGELRRLKAARLRGLLGEN
jgi:hypothetical protein